MKRVKKLVLFIAVICFAAAASGCDAFDNFSKIIVGEAGITNEKSNKTEITNSISLGILDFDTFNPLLTKSETVKECMMFVYEPLFELDEKLRPVPVLAKDYTVSPDGRTIDITLRENILWHNGSAFNAYDVAYTIKQIRSGVTTYSSSLSNMADYMATGDYSIRINLSSAVPDFVSFLTFPIVQFKSDMNTNPNYIPIGTGAFRYDTQLSSGKMSFAAFDSYHNGRAKLDTLYVYTVPDLQKYESMFEANEIDAITGDAVDLSEYTPRGNAKNNEYITNKMTFVGYNLRNELLQGAQTRQGLSKLIDKESIVNSIIYSRGVPADVPINPSSIYYYDTNTRFKSDEVLAASHLGNDGWGVDSGGKYSRIVNGSRQTLGFEILTDGDSREKTAIAEKIAESFNAFGIPAVVETLPYEEFMARVGAGNYDIMIGEEEINPNNDLTPLVSSTGNYFSYQNTNLDMLIGQMGMTRDEEQLKTLFCRYGDTLMQDMPFTPLFFAKGNVLSGSKIKSRIEPSIGRLYRNVETWSVKE